MQNSLEALLFRHQLVTTIQTGQFPLKKVQLSMFTLSQKLKVQCPLLSSEESKVEK